jgi:hypothetical protein
VPAQLAGQHRRGEHGGQPAEEAEQEGEVPGVDAHRLDVHGQAAGALGVGGDAAVERLGRPLGCGAKTWLERRGAGPGGEQRVGQLLHAAHCLGGVAPERQRVDRPGDGRLGGQLAAQRAPGGLQRGGGGAPLLPEGVHVLVRGQAHLAERAARGGEVLDARCDHPPSPRK